jgi:dTDP-glucose 4,6-dehydratase
MTIEAAVHLVLRAATQGESGDTLILNMGDPVSIMDIANKLIKSSGKEIELQFTALRPGEKLNELLVGKNEKILESNYSEIVSYNG